MIVTVVGVSLKGKNRIREHGDRWTVIRHEKAVLCCNNKPGVLLQAPSGCQRWMANEDDSDFFVMTVEDSVAPEVGKDYSPKWSV